MLKSSSHWRRTPALALDAVVLGFPLSTSGDATEEAEVPTSKPVTCCRNGSDTSSTVGLSEICSSGGEGGAASPGVELQTQQAQKQQQQQQPPPQQQLQQDAQAQLSLNMSVPNHRTMTKTKSTLSLSSMSGNDLAALISPAKPKDKRTMRFSSTVRVCLVPTREELKVVIDDLFFRPEDYTRFKSEAVTELRDVLVKLGVTSKQAIEILYQPQPRGTDYYRAPTSRSKAHRHHQHRRGGSSARRGKVTPDGSDGSGSTDEDASSAEDEDEARMAAASASASEGPSLSDDEGEETETEGMEVKNGKRVSGSEKDGGGKSAEAAAAAAASASASAVAAARAREAQCAPNAAAAALVRHMPSPVPEEGPTLSDDEEEQAMVIESQTKSLKFITGIKTDIELNHDMQTKMQQQGAVGKDGRSLPVRTPSGRDAQSDNGTVWYSKWQKSAAQVVDVLAEHKSAMASSPCIASSSFLSRGVSPNGSSTNVKALPIKEATQGVPIVKAKSASVQAALPSSSPAKGSSSPNLSPAPFSSSSLAPEVKTAKAMSPWQRKAAGLA